MAITPLPSLDRMSATFKSDVDLFFGSKLPAFVGEANMLAATLSSIAAGGAFSAPYKFAVDPGPIGTAAGGFLSFDAASDASTTTKLYVDLKTMPGASVDAFLTAITGSSSAVKAYARVVSLSDPSKSASFAVTGYSRVTSAYGHLIVTPISSNPTASPFAANDLVVLFIQRSGDKGDTGSMQTFPTMYVRDEKPSGTAAQTGVVSTWNARTLNTVKYNDIPGASLSGNAVTLPAGTYEYEGSAPAYSVGGHMARLTNQTDASVIEYGTAESNSTSTGMATRSVLRGRFTLATSKAVRIDHWITSAATGGVMGNTVSTGGTEVYTEIRFRKVA